MSSDAAETGQCNNIPPMFGAATNKPDLAGRQADAGRVDRGHAGQRAVCHADEQARDDARRNELGEIAQRDVLAFGDGRRNRILRQRDRCDGERGDDAGDREAGDGAASSMVNNSTWPRPNAPDVTTA